MDTAMKDEPITKCATCHKELVTGCMPDWLIRIECVLRPSNADASYTVDICPPFEGILQFCNLECLKIAVNHER